PSPGRACGVQSIQPSALHPLLGRAYSTNKLSQLYNQEASQSGGVPIPGCFAREATVRGPTVDRSATTPIDGHRPVRAVVDGEDLAQGEELALSRQPTDHGDHLVLLS